MHMLFQFGVIGRIYFQTRELYPTGEQIFSNYKPEIGKYMINT